MEKSELPTAYDYDQLAYAEIIQAVLILASTWQELNESNNNQQFWNKLEEIQNALRRIESQLFSIELRLSDIQKQIALLPEKIRGIIRENDALKALSEVKAISQNVRDYCRPNLVDSSIQYLKGSMDDLQKLVWIIKEAKGISGLFLTAPIMATWMTAATVRAKALQRTDPTFDVIANSPWKSSFMLDTKIEYDDTFKLFADTSDYIDSFVIPHFPVYEEMQFIIRNKGMYYFEKVPPPPPYYAPNDKFLVRQDSVTKREFVCGWSTFFNEFIEINPNTANNDARMALAAMSQFTTDRLESKEFSVSVEKLLLDRKKIYQFFDEPQNIWKS